MTAAQPTGNYGNTEADKKSLHLPKDLKQKQALKNSLDKYIKELESTGQGAAKIQQLKLRKKLIDSQGLSMQRIDNLESIFLYYCTQVFKNANKQITFERMEYEKTHLTMERFFAFLKDFNLNTAVVDQTVREVVDKNDIVLLFKKASINCKDVSFEQFLALLQKIAVLYYDSKTNYRAKIQRIARQRQKRKEANLKNQLRRKAALEAARSQINRVQGQEEVDNDDKETVVQEKREVEQEVKVDAGKSSSQQIQKHENDNFVTSLLNDKSIQNPHLEITAKFQEGKEMGQQAAEVEPEGQQSVVPLQISESNVIQDQIEELLALTVEQKIQYFYKIIDVDDNASFKRKMKELNMELLHCKPRKVSTQVEKVRDSKSYAGEDISEQRRLQEIRDKLKEKQEKDRKDRSYSHISPRQLGQPKQNQIVKRSSREQLDLGRKKISAKSNKIDLANLSIDLSSLSKISSDQINFGKFNPKKFQTEEVDPYLDEYFSVNPLQKNNEKRVPFHLESNDKVSMMMQQKLKKRTEELEQLDRNQESKYTSSNSMVSMAGSWQAQARKNRLMQKLVKLQRQ